MCLAQGSQCSEAGEALTQGPSVSSQALYHWATALKHKGVESWVWMRHLKNPVSHTSAFGRLWNEDFLKYYVKMEIVLMRS